MDLVGAAEIAEMLGLTRQRINAIVRTHEDFPRPVADLSAGRIWRRKDVEDWARRTGRLR
jgi:prophage regulatory protein